jgi:prepilin-type processing-associated H-X9-DG protein
VYDAPQHGGLLITGIVLAVDVKDASGLQRVIEKLTALAREALAEENVDVRVRETKIGGHSIQYTLFGGVPVPVAPAWAFAEGRWVVGLYPQTVAAALSQIVPATRGKSVLDHPDVQAARKHLPEKWTAFSYTDARVSFRVYYTLLQLGRAAVASLTADSKAAFDMGAAPTYAAALQDVRPMVFANAPDADGVLYCGVGVTPSAFLFSGGSGGDLATTAMAVSVLLPSLSRARELAKRTVCAANLRGMGQACHIYANDHDDQFPPDLATLVKENMTTPLMHVCPSSGDTEGEATAALQGGPGTLRYHYIAGQRGAGDPQNVLVYEDLDNHNGEGGNILFLDGHVEFRKPPEFKQAIQETFARLKREAEIPAEFK